MNSAHHLLTTLGVPDAAFTGGTLRARSPIDGSTTGMVLGSANQVYVTGGLYTARIDQPPVDGTFVSGFEF